MKKFIKSKLVLQIVLACAVATLATAGIVGATTIGTNMSSDGTLTVVGANTLYGATSIGGALTATSTLAVLGASTLTGALTVYGNSTLSNATATGTLAVVGVLNVNGYATTTAAGIIMPTQHYAANSGCSAGTIGGLIFNSSKQILCVCTGTTWKAATSTTAVDCF